MFKNIDQHWPPTTWSVDSQQAAARTPLTDARALLYDRPRWARHHVATDDEHELTVELVRR